MNSEPYYAVIFTSKKATNDVGYEAMAQQMLDLSRQQKGFIGVESVRDVEGNGITISYWKTKEDIVAWKNNSIHLKAQKLGREQWYENYKVRICKVEGEYGV